jgi:hypothetical protein
VANIATVAVEKMHYLLTSQTGREFVATKKDMVIVVG